MALCSMRKVEAKVELVRSSMALVRKSLSLRSVIASLMTMANRRVGLSALLGFRNSLSYFSAVFLSVTLKLRLTSS